MRWCMPLADRAILAPASEIEAFLDNSQGIACRLKTYFRPLAGCCLSGRTVVANRLESDPQSNPLRYLVFHCTQSRDGLDCQRYKRRDCFRTRRVSNECR